MLGNFCFYNPSRMYFGKDALDALNTEMPKVGKKIMLVYGGGSIKKNGIYDAVTAILAAQGKTVVEDAGVPSNPTVDRLKVGCALARENAVDFILAIGGGSVCDYSKAVGASAYYDGDAWEHFYVNDQPVENPVIPMGCILTMVGTGTEMNSGSVLTNTQQKKKIGHTFSDSMFPKFSILNPEFTFSLPKYQMSSGIFDIMSHILEQYLSDFDDNTSDYMSEGLLRGLINSARVAVKDPCNYEARSNIMWTASMACNNLLSRGKTTDWMAHKIGESISANTNATHGMTLSAISLAYYRFIMPYGISKFKNFAVNVWNVDPTGKTDECVANEGLEAMEAWMKEIGVVMSVKELGVTDELVEQIANTAIIAGGSYKVPNREEIAQILRDSM